jgi:hypothetical protein
MTTFTHYTRVEGGDWLPWKAGAVDGRSLRKRVPFGTANPVVEMNGLTLHALKADDGRAWDCINGWREAPVMNGDTQRQPEDVIEERREVIDLPVVETPAARIEALTREMVQASAVHPLDPPPAAGTIAANLAFELESADRERAQAYAMRIWSGQTAEMKRAERIRRCEVALKGQGLPTDGVKYPGAGENAEIPVRFDPKAQQSPAQALAMRIWNGQSNVVHRPERIARIERALQEQGFSIDGIRYPASADRYDEADDEPVFWRMKMPGAEGIV